MLPEDTWITVRNWEKFQHYSNRDPVWIKLYTSLNSDDDWRSLTWAKRGLLVTIWLEYARSNGLLTVRHIVAIYPAICTRWGHLYKNIESLNHAGFIDLSASKPLSLEKKREKEKSALARKSDAPAAQPAAMAPAGASNTQNQNAAAYQPFDNTPPDIEPDQTAIDLARKWLREHHP